MRPPAAARLATVGSCRPVKASTVLDEQIDGPGSWRMHQHASRIHATSTSQLMSETRRQETPEYVPTAAIVALRGSWQSGYKNRRSARLSHLSRCGSPRCITGFSVPDLSTQIWLFVPG